MNRKMWSRVLLLIVMFSARAVGYSQNTFRSLPVSFNDIGLSDDFNSVILPFINIDSLEGLPVDTNKIPRARYGFPTEVDIDFMSEATCEILSDGSRICRLAIISNEGPIGLNMICDSFFIPKGAKLYLYNADTSTILGGFTDINNNLQRKFPCGLLSGNTLIIDYYEPVGVIQTGILHISRFVQITEQVFDTSTTRQGDPFYCYIDTICEPDWCDQRRSVILIFDGDGEVRCSGALITNGRRDLTPYVLTAHHCLDLDASGSLSQPEKNAVASWIFYFNSQSQTCGASGGNYGTHRFPINGANFRVGAQKSDFALLELNTKPPGAYNVFYSGWSKENPRPKSGAVIHHPLGRSKKINLYDEKPKRKTTNEDIFKLPSSKVRVWQLEKFSDGTATHPGSSGAPMYNQSKVIVGQHLGNEVVVFDVLDICDEADNIMYNQGRFRVSMAQGAIDFLDPDHTISSSILAISGDEPPCDFNLNFTNIPNFPSGLFEASNNITASNNVIVQPGSTVEFSAGNRVHLLPGFSAKAGSNFHAFIEGCKTGCGTGVGKTGEEAEPFIIYKDDLEKDTIINVSSYFSIYPNPNSGQFTIDLPEETYANIHVFDMLGNLVYIEHLFGRKQTTIDISTMSKGVYFLHASQGGQVFTEKIIVR